MPASILRQSKYATGALKAAGDPSEPLLSTTDSLSSEGGGAVSATAPPSDDDGRTLTEGLTGKGLMSTVGVGILAVAGLAASAAAMIAAPGAAVIIMGGLCLVNSPVVATKHVAIAKSAGVRGSVNAIRGECVLLKSEVDFLEEQVNDLQAEANSLVGIERKLQAIAREQGTNANNLVELVKDNENILKQMRHNCKENFVASMAQIVIRSDKDGDMKIDLNELPMLAIRLQIHLDTFGIKLDTDLFEQMIKEDNDIANVLKFCEEVLFEDSEDAANDGDDDSVGSDNSDLTFDFESFCNDLKDEGDNNGGRGSQRMSRAARKTMVRDMVTIGDKFSQGSVDKARGRKMTILPGKSSRKASHDKRKTIVKEVKRRQTKMRMQKDAGAGASRRLRDTRITLGGLVQIRGTSAEC